ncbi:putative mitochondrial protein [Nicotiana attenuata]|uniref:Mitochondrial protein n=1 Tax=Nicotiana attenuata TaxID=49451 RepID=A0A314KXM2_NICAT|nr:putative mitochondrial protein [Nicotiana attenuata]
MEVSPCLSLQDDAPPSLEVRSSPSTPPPCFYSTTVPLTSSRVVTRSQNNIFKPKQFFDYLAVSPNKTVPLVDDIIVTGSSIKHTDHTIKLLGNKFSIKDLGSLHFFLGVKVIPYSDGLLLAQSNYIAELLDKYHMLEANGVATPMSTSEHLSINDGTGSTAMKLYRQVIGSLQYLSFTRPDICFTINSNSSMLHRFDIEKQLRACSDTSKKHSPLNFS